MGSEDTSKERRLRDLARLEVLAEEIRREDAGALLRNYATGLVASLIGHDKTPELRTLIAKNWFNEAMANGGNDELIRSLIRFLTAVQTKWEAQKPPLKGGL